MSIGYKFFYSVFLLIVCVHATAIADWPCQPGSSIPVVTAAGNQWNVRLASDNAGGSYLAWQDRRTGLLDKIYLQRIDAFGNPQWITGGIALATTGGYQYYPQLLPDGTGGVYVVWQDNRSGADYDIFLQRIAPTGTPLWADNGVVVCNASGNQYNPQIVLDPSGNVLVVWQDRRSGNYDIFAQRFSPQGIANWSANGVPVCIESGDQVEPKLVSEGNGGALVAWTDYRGGTGFSDLYVQRVTPLGKTAIGGSPGTLLCGAANSQWNIQMVPDGANGAIVVWQDRRSAQNEEIFAQRVTINCQLLWSAGGVDLSTATGLQYYPTVASDKANGAIVTWQENRNGTDYDIYAQRIDALGQLSWGLNGASVCTQPGHQYYPQVTSQGANALIFWQDRRGNEFHIYGQALQMSGLPLWAGHGVQISSGAVGQVSPQIVSDGVHGAIVSWADYQLGTGFTDLFAQRMGANGKPAGGCYRTFSQDSLSLRAVKLFTRSTGAQKPNTGNVRDSVFARGAFSRGLVVGLERRDSARSYGWQYFTKSLYVRRFLPQLGQAAPFDRIYNLPFFGMKKNPSPSRFNNKLGGELLALKINIAASDAGISESHFGDLVYSDTSMRTSPLNGLTLREVVGSVDSMMTMWKRYVGLVNYDSVAKSLRKINLAFSGPIDTLSTRPLKITSTKALFSLPFLIPDTKKPAEIAAFQPVPEEEEVPKTYSLFQNYPNPFNPLTTIEFQLSEPAIVSLTIYNLLGQEVAVLVDQMTFDDGRQILDFDASALASGVYFYRLTATPLAEDGKAFSQIRKMMLLK